MEFFNKKKNMGVWKKKGDIRLGIGDWEIIFLC